MEHPLNAAVEVNNAEIVDYLLDRVSYDINATKHRRGKTLLHVACEADRININIIQNILNYGIKVNIGDHYGATALHYACMNGDKNVIELLIIHGADVNYCNEYSEYRCSPIYMAIFERYIDVIELLLKHGAEVLTISTNVSSVLESAMAFPLPDAAKLLLKHVANLSSGTKLDWTTLSCAVYDSNVNLTKHLLENGHEIDMLTSYSASICENCTILEIIWNKIAVDTVSNDLYFMIHIFDNLRLNDSFEKLMLLLSKEGVDLHLERCSRAFAFFIERSSTTVLRYIGKDQLSQLIQHLVSRGLRLHPSEVTRIINMTYNSRSKQLFEIIIDTTLPKISKENFYRGLEKCLGKYLIQYCLEVDPDMLLCDLDFVQYCLGIFTFPDEDKHDVIDLFSKRGDMRMQDVCRMLKRMEVKSLIALSRDAIRTHLKKVCIDVRQFLYILDQLRLPDRIKDIIQCKTPVNKYDCKYG